MRSSIRKMKKKKERVLADARRTESPQQDPFLRSGMGRRWFFHSVCVLLLIAAIFFGAFAGVLVWYSESSMESSLLARSRATARFFEKYIQPDSDDFASAALAYAEGFEKKDSLELQFLDLSGGVLVSSTGPVTLSHPGTEDITCALAGEEGTYRGRDPRTGKGILAVCVPVTDGTGEVMGLLRYVSGTRLLLRQLLLSLGAAVVGIVLILLASLYSSRFFLRSVVIPVREISATASRIASGSYGVLIQKSYHDEIGELADTINELSIRISQSEKTQAEFISSVSHELRTPLTAIAGWSETLLTGEDRDEESRRGLRIIANEANRMTKLVTELLEFSRMQDGRFTLQVLPDTDIRAVFEDTVFVYGNSLRREGIELEYEENDDEIPPVSCDPERMKQVFLNLLDNAAKHGGEGKRIVTSVCAGEGNVEIRIRDFGPGIPEEELPLVKKKFYKGSSRARGSGIGLAVCDEIVTMHNGTLTLENAEPGTLVTIRLPIEA